MLKLKNPLRKKTPYVYPDEGTEASCATPAQKKPLAVSLWNTGYSVRGISKTLHMKETQVRKALREQKIYVNKLSKAEREQREATSREAIESSSYIDLFVDQHTDDQREYKKLRRAAILAGEWEVTPYPGRQ